MFLNNFWYIAALRREIEARPMRRIILGEPIVLYRTPDGAAVALEDRCIHREVPLSKGEVLPDGGLRCIYHGMVFDRSGACLHIPEQTRVPAAARVKNYPLVERYEWAWVWMGDPALADPKKIPEYGWFDCAGWKARTARIHVKCNYRFIVDNLLNMAHLPFVHPRTIGSEGVVKDAKVTTTRTGHRVLLQRRMYDIEPPPTYKKAGGFEGNVNRWQNIEFIAPSFFEFNTGVIDAGNEIPNIKDRAEPKEGVRILSRHTMHGIVPETEKTAHYYVGFSFNPEEMSDEVADFVFDSVYKTFMEDVDILEAQQINVDLFPNAKKIDIASDAAGMHAMRIIDELERAEGESTSAVA
jgi:phenylpropionate dioxygenase-like ring-hydroxylating dioxygenase large terminal subunit